MKFSGYIYDGDKVMNHKMPGDFHNGHRLMNFKKSGHFCDAPGLMNCENLAPFCDGYRLSCRDVIKLRPYRVTYGPYKEWLVPITKVKEFHDGRLLMNYRKLGRFYMKGESPAPRRADLITHFPDSGENTNSAGRPAEFSGRHYVQKGSAGAKGGQR